MFYLQLPAYISNSVEKKKKRKRKQKLTFAEHRIASRQSNPII
jgi:hypothetical protein